MLLSFSHIFTVFTKENNKMSGFLKLSDYLKQFNFLFEMERFNGIWTYLSQEYTITHSPSDPKVLIFVCDGKDIPSNPILDILQILQGFFSEDDNIYYSIGETKPLIVYFYRLMLCVSLLSDYTIDGGDESISRSYNPKTLNRILRKFEKILIAYADILFFIEPEFMIKFTICLSNLGSNLQDIAYDVKAHDMNKFMRHLFSKDFFYSQMVLYTSNPRDHPCFRIIQADPYLARYCFMVPNPVDNQEDNEYNYLNPDNDESFDDWRAEVIRQDSSDWIFTYFEEKYGHYLLVEEMDIEQRLRLIQDWKAEKRTNEYFRDCDTSRVDLLQSWFEEYKDFFQDLKDNMVWIDIKTIFEDLKNRGYYPTDLNLEQWYSLRFERIQANFEEEYFQEGNFQEGDFQEEDFQEGDFQEGDFQEGDFQEGDFQEGDFK